jgi:heat shock protein HtpX
MPAVTMGLWALFLVLFLLMCNEGIHWIQNGTRSDWADIVAILFIGITVYLATQDVMTSIMGAFSIYLIFGMVELKDYEILNKIVLITVITYNVIFIAGLIDIIIGLEGVLRDTVFSMSFFLMLILGFIVFGRKYMIVFRFMSTQYLTLLFYLVAWLGVAGVWKITGVDMTGYIYEILIGLNFIIYLFSGPLIDLLMGYKKVDSPELEELVNEVAPKMGFNPKKIKIRYGKYPILNAMAYGCVGIDYRMAVISPELEFGRGKIGKDEIRGIIAHELGHLKGKHTLILTLVSAVQLIAFKLLKWPATFFDYTFKPDDQPFPLWVFILINFALTLVFYIVVRELESRADRITRRTGYAKDLAKGLYNLEGYYATSHEIGLDATLLSDEKISTTNRLLNYLSTAKYLNQNVLKPTKGTLLSNLINAHPPTYHRIMASLHTEEISPRREAVMPMTFLNSQKAHEFAVEVQEARMRYTTMATEKVRDEFELDDIRTFLTTMKVTEELQYKIGKTYAFLNLLTYDRLFARIEEIEYVDNAAEPLSYKISVIREDGSSEPESQILNPSLYKEIPISLQEHYPFRKEGILHFTGILINELYQNPKKKPTSLEKLSPKQRVKNMGTLVFENSEGKVIKKPLFDTRLPKSLEYFREFQNKTVFLKEQGVHRITTLDQVNIPEKGQSLEKLSWSLKDPSLECSQSDYLLRFEHPYFGMKAEERTLKAERAILDYFYQTKQRIYIILKKAVNAEIDGHITAIDLGADSEKENKPTTTIHVHSIFGEDHVLELSKIDALYLNTPSVVLQKKSTVSSFTMLMNRWKQWRHPERILL